MLPMKTKAEEILYLKKFNMHMEARKNHSEPPSKYYKNPKKNDKTAELALFYNLALERMNNLIDQYENEKISIDKDKDFFKTIDAKLFSEKTYLLLKIYLWKEPIEKGFSTVSQADIKLINQILKKLVELRNLQSHYYHGLSASYVNSEIVDFVKVQLEKIKNQLAAKYPHFVKYINILETDTYKHFNFFEINNSGKYVITDEGKNFFLSFFLTKGEMTLFLKKRNRCKRDNGEKYQVKHEIYKYLCHRDGSSRFLLKAKEQHTHPQEMLERQFNSILNYLKTIPVCNPAFIPPTIKELTPKKDRSKKEDFKREEETQEEHEVVRRKNKFMELAVQYIKDYNQLHGGESLPIYWHTQLFKYEEHTVDAKPKTEKREAQKEYTYFSQEKVFDAVANEVGYLAIKQGHIKFKLGLGKGAPEYLIHETELKNWIYFLVHSANQKTLSETIDVIQKYGNEYKSAMKELIDSNQISFKNYPMVFEKGKDSKILSEMHLKILEGKKFNIDEYRELIKVAIIHKTTKLKAEKKSITTLTRNRKNRIVLHYLNHYLPKGDKLTPAEVNTLSIFNFVSDNQKVAKETRQKIVQPLEKKLQSITETTELNLVTFDKKQIVYTIFQATSLDELFIKMLEITEKYFDEIQSRIADFNEDQLLKLGPMFEVSLPGTNKSSTSKERLTELKDTINRKPILLPNGLFKRAFLPSEKSSISQLVYTKEGAWKKILIKENYDFKKQKEFVQQSPKEVQIPTFWIDFVADNYAGVFDKGNEVAKYQDLIKELIKKANKTEQEHYKDADNAIAEYRSLRETLVKDMLLGQILYHYHQKVYTQLADKPTYASIAELHEMYYNYNLGNKTFKIKYKQLDDLNTVWDTNKLQRLVNNVHYWGAEYDKQLREKSQRAVELIRKKLYTVYLESHTYIDNFLTLEKLVYSANSHQKDVLIEESKKGKGAKFYGEDRIEPEIILKYAGVPEDEIKEFVRLRNGAFHADIPQQTNYSALTAKLKSYIEKIEALKR